LPGNRESYFGRAVSRLTAGRQCQGVASPLESPEALLIRAGENRQLNDLIAALPAEFRECLVLRELEELSYKEIAAVTGVPIGTVMSRLARARRLIQRGWAAEGG
jgi:RNA polymerase sigma factor (sigma-70 family)